MKEVKVYSKQNATVLPTLNQSLNFSEIKAK